MLGVYMKYSFACEKTRPVFSKDVFFSMRELFLLCCCFGCNGLLQRFIVAVILFFCHNVLVYAFRSKKEIADMGPLLCLSIVIFQGP
ncbi:protein DETOXIFICATION 1-like [Quercus lobata]|uniref:protein DETOXIFICATION 1-like n=1 Tax=Quercus lobata TaxID=97700 RepID=UPI001246047C|nr:protein DETOXIFICATION 1-like [Quercus lobata]